MLSTRIVTTTVQLPLELTSEQEQLLLMRCELIRDITNAAIELNISKITNMIKLTYQLYRQLKSLYPTASTVDVQQCVRRAASCYKALTTRVLRLSKKLEWYTEHNKVVPKKLQRQYDAVCSSTPHLQKVSLLPLTSQQVRWNISSGTIYLSGFIKGELLPFKFKNYTYASQQLQGAKLGQCTICKHTSGKWYLHVTVSRITEVDLNPIQPVLGVDQGIKNLVTTSSGLVINGDDTWQRCERIMRQRSALQAKGTRSAKRKLRRTCSRYRHYVSDTLHCISKRVVEEAQQRSCQAIALEWLHIPPNLIGNPHLRKAIAKWPYQILSSYITYKAERVGINVVAVPPQHTSDTCSKCLYSDKANRPEQAIFRCERCGYTQHADLNAAYNISRLGYIYILEILQHRLQLF